MDRKEMWRHIAEQRLAVAEALIDLDPDEWERPSLCEGWRVRDVVAHIGLAPEITWGMTLREFARAHGSFHRFIRETAIDRAALPNDELIAIVRRVAPAQRLAPGTTTKEPLLDILVHAQDIFLPLGRDFTMPEHPALVAADRIWQIPPPFGFGAKKRLRGFRVSATDAPWSRGDGPSISGPLQAIVLLISGRVTAALPYLSGDGVQTLAVQTKE
ncbi:maleylpyruvate isomerase family mycothiol-dependent enzyme [Actinomadura sp. BRA 177]|uniref:maleylpyruvate isomerase family mycothiol-dependent enzyme n=1 Tax=Actinomadura sp. BRA 177 TaxID=2745202 RepID=UPI001595EB3F|nr:maleylpyruvate isomerase family mycothiol-dependent enzyme [Actinomadura sp. BRA 177]NVI92683.1 maleylpyruvate isomerase family mycothiol-dependent enzyme [Actinomadura sp. BRA 177]